MEKKLVTRVFCAYFKSDFTWLSILQRTQINYLNFTQVTYLNLPYRDSNLGPLYYKPDALPIELTGIT